MPLSEGSSGWAIEVLECSWTHCGARAVQQRKRPSGRLGEAHFAKRSEGAKRRPEPKSTDIGHLAGCPRIDAARSRIDSGPPRVAREREHSSVHVRSIAPLALLFGLALAARAADDAPAE